MCKKIPASAWPEFFYLFLTKANAVSANQAVRSCSSLPGLADILNLQEYLRPPGKIFNASSNPESVLHTDSNRKFSKSHQSYEPWSFLSQERSV